MTEDIYAAVFCYPHMTLIWLTLTAIGSSTVLYVFGDGGATGALTFICAIEGDGGSTGRSTDVC